MSSFAKIISYSQIILAVLVVIGIVLQQRGTGLSSAFGGSSMEYSTKRGVEKGIFIATIVFAIAWLGVSVARLLI